MDNDAKTKRARMKYKHKARVMEHKEKMADIKSRKNMSKGAQVIREIGTAATKNTGYIAPAVTAQVTDSSINRRQTQDVTNQVYQSLLTNGVIGQGTNTSSTTNSNPTAIG